MVLKIGTEEFTIDPINAFPTLDGIPEFMIRQNKGWHPIYRWICPGPPKSLTEGSFTLLLDCVVSFAVMKKPTSAKVDKKKTSRERDSFVLLTGLPEKKLVAAIRAAVGPVKVEMDARPSIQKWGKVYSFDVEMIMMSTYHILRPEKNPGFGYIIVGIPNFHAFMMKKKGTCKGAHMLRDPMDKWFGAVGKNEIHDGWMAEHDKNRAAYNERWRKRIRKRNKKKGITMPKED